MQFSLSRIKRLVYRDWILYRKPVLYSLFLVVFASLFIFWLPTTEQNFNNYDTGFWAGWYFSFLFIGGLLLASILFWEFKTPAGRIQFLSLPANNLEKLTSRSIYPHFIYPIFLSFMFFVAYNFAKAGGNSELLHNTFWEALPFVIGGYLCAVSLILVFSIAINKYVVPKTVIIAIIIYFVFLFIFFIIFRLTMHELFEGFSMNRNFEMKMENQKDFEMIGESCLTLIKFILWIIIPGFFYTVAYFKMKEKQV